MHEDLIAWDEDERKQCRYEWERRVCEAIDEQEEIGMRPDREAASFDVGVDLVRELRKLRRKVEK